MDPETWDLITKIPKVRPWEQFRGKIMDAVHPQE
jgi:hypothetical protein